LGYLQVFLLMIDTKAGLFVIVSLTSLAWFVPNLLAAVQSIGDFQPLFTTPEGLRLQLPGRHQLGTIALIVAFVAAVLIGLYGSSIRRHGRRGAIPLRPCDRSAARRRLGDLLQRMQRR
jgi:hypothetical protein